MIILGNCEPTVRWQLRLLHTLLICRLRKNASTRIATQVEKVIAILDQTQVVMNTNLRTTAGMAHFRKNQIDLHVRLLENKPEELESTYAHELGHLIAGYLFGEWGHGVKWKLVMHYLESDDSRCHTLDVSAFQRRDRKPNFEAA